MSQITVQLSKQFIGVMLITGTITRRTVITKGLPDDAELIDVSLTTEGLVEYVYDCPSDTGEDRTSVVEITTMGNI